MINGARIFEWSFHLMTGASDNGWEDSARSVITGKPSLDQAGAVVTYEGGGLVVVTHVWSFSGWPSRLDRKQKQNTNRLNKASIMLDSAVFWGGNISSSLH